MKIHDALILELIKPDKSGKPNGDIIKIVGTANINYKLEESEHFASEAAPSVSALLEGRSQIIVEEMAPDIIATKTKVTSEEAEVVIELETDVDFYFGKSLRQIKNYKKRFCDLRVIIPKEC